jgi:hypothetical protein
MGTKQFRAPKMAKSKIEALFAAAFGQVLGELVQQTHTSI